MTAAKPARAKSLLELLGDGRTRELERYHAARYGKPSLLERILTRWARQVTLAGAVETPKYQPTQNRSREKS